MTKLDLLAASSDQLRQLIEQRVSNQVLDASANYNIAGLAPEQQAAVLHLMPEQRVEAAVLMPIVMRAEGLQLLFTQRAEHMRRHPGQISFPGGRIEPTDDSPLDAALRETEEEIGLSRDYIQPVGYLPPLLIFSGYAVTPIVGFVQPGFELQLDASEVAEAFEVPLRYFLDSANHLARERQFGGMTVNVYDFPYHGRRIWGATAGIIMSLYRLMEQGIP